MIEVTAYTSAGELPLLASVDCRLEIPYGTSREERHEILDGCEVHLFTRKTGRRVSRIEAMLTDSELASIRKQLRESTI